MPGKTETRPVFPAGGRTEAEAPATLGEWLEFAIAAYERHRVSVGQVADNFHDDALFLLLRLLDLPLDSDASVLGRRLSAAESRRVRAALIRRTEQHVPTAYLLGETWLGGHRFRVDKRVIIPRSYFVELIPRLADYLPAGAVVRNAADICTGSACLAILLAHAFPGASVDATDISSEALALAAENVREHRCTGRVHLHCADVLDGVPVPEGAYDLIISNPPYEPSAHVDRQRPEFKAEPRLAHDGGPDGLVIIRKIVEQALPRLAPHGVLLIEVGGLRKLVQRSFGALRPEWPETADEHNCVCLFRKAR